LLDIVPVTHDTIIVAMSDAMIVLNAQNRVIDLNPAASRLIGWNMSAVFGRPIQQVLSGFPTLIAACYGEIETRLEIVFNPSPPPARLEIASAPAKGPVGLVDTESAAKRHYEAQVLPQSDAHGKITGRLLTLRDITARRQAEETQRFLAEASTLLASSLDY